MKCLICHRETGPGAYVGFGSPPTAICGERVRPMGDRDISTGRGPGFIQMLRRARALMAKVERDEASRQGPIKRSKS